MGLYATKSRFQAILEPLVQWLVARRVNPDVLTYSALGLSLLSGGVLVVAQSNRHLLLLVPPAVIARLVLNVLDGQLARRMGKAGPWGEVKNELSDRLADGAIFLGIGFGGYADPRLAIFSLGVVLLVPWMGILGKAVAGERIYSGILGKPERMLLLALFVFYPWWTGDLSSFNLFLGAVIVLGTITVGQRLWRLRGRIQSPG